jgi:predicted dehydrogenase
VINVSLIGCGLIGNKRADALLGLANLVSCYDKDRTASEKLAQKYNCKVEEDLERMLSCESIQAVFVSTRHDSLVPIAKRALEAGKHVLIEKPGGLSEVELRSIQKIAESKDLRVHVGYNHRYHRGIMQAFKIIKDDKIGELLFFRARYGHGGRRGYEREWRSNKVFSGGGELIDQGTHLLDLAQEILGEISIDYAATPNYFWNMDVEDNAFIVVKNKTGAIGFFHVSCTEWKNTFSLEIYGKMGKLEINGLGGSYGTEKLTYFKMNSEMGPPETFSWEYPMQDNSWTTEIKQFIDDIVNGSRNSSNLESSLRILNLVNEIYVRTGR